MYDIDYINNAFFFKYNIVYSIMIIIIMFVKYNKFKFKKKKEKEIKSSKVKKY